jgi:elongation factor G
MQVKAYCADSELTRYSITLRSLTQGRGSFAKQFAHYAPMADNAAKSIVEEYQNSRSH